MYSVLVYNTMALCYSRHWYTRTYCIVVNVLWYYCGTIVVHRCRGPIRVPVAEPYLTCVNSSEKPAMATVRSSGRYVGASPLSSVLPAMAITGAIDASRLRTSSL